MEIVKIVRAFKPGDVVFIECDMMLSQQQKETIRNSVGVISEAAGIKVIILDAGLRLAAREEQREEVCSQ